MTFSIVACDLGEKMWGVAVASRFLAVGSMVPTAETGVGALATQARTNVGYREQGLAMLRTGLGAKEALAALLADDPGRDERQVGLVDHAGAAVSWTGPKCLPYAGGRTGDGYAVQGNLLAGPDVLDAMVSTWAAADGSVPLAHRLLAALASGDAAGGDRRGRQASALFVVGPTGRYRHGSTVEVDLRVDDAADPIGELARLLALHDVLTDDDRRDQAVDDGR